MEYLSVWDVVLTPIFLILLVYVGSAARDKRYPPGHPLRQFFMPGLLAKFGGAIFIGVVYAFYYKGGDTFNYFEHAKIINSSLQHSVSDWFKLVTHADPASNPEIYSYTSQLYWYNSRSEYAVGVITAILGLFSFTTYFPTAILFAFLAYSGIWAMYKTFANLYPAYTKALAFAFLFIPSTLVWGSGIFKDTICMFGLGWMTYSTFRIFVNRDVSLRNIFLMVFSFYLIAIIKLYILMGFLPALLLWLMLTYSKNIPNKAIRWITNILLLGVVVGSFLLFASKFSDELNSYSLEKITQTASVTRSWTNYAAGDEGSAYSIGEMDGSLESMLRLFPQALTVSLFRPFPWEVRKVIQVLSALEALAFIYFTILVLTSRKSKKIGYLFKEPTLLFAFVFVLIFAFAVGISSGNFGALSRYRIPALPFYGVVLAIMLGEKYRQKARTA